MDIKHRLHDPLVLAILAYSQYKPTGEKLRALVDAYAADPMVCAFACAEDGAVAGVIVVKRREGGHVEIVSLAVDRQWRGKGIGSGMVAFVASRFASCSILAETDDEAVGFYRRCGFSVESLGEKYPGVVRYLCKLSPRQATAPLGSSE